MSYSIRIVAEASKKATRTTANLKLVIFKTSYRRVPKSLRRSVELKDWDKNKERLKSSSTQADVLNLYLNATEKKLYDQIYLWESRSINWNPKQLMSILDSKSDKPQQTKAVTVVDFIDRQIDFFKTKERFKNGEKTTGSSNWENYQWLKNSLLKFTQFKYKKNFGIYTFKDITESFLRSYSIYIQEKGFKNNNKGGLKHKLTCLKAVFRLAQKEKVSGVDLSIFEVVKDKMKASKTTPRVLSEADFIRIRDFDRTKLSKKECFHLDLFLFSYYSGGMANVDVCYLNKSCFKDNYIEYVRRKCDKVANPIFLPQIHDIIDCYKDKTYGNYVLPIFNERQQSETQKHSKVERITLSVNKTLAKISLQLGMTKKVTWYYSRGTYITKAIDSGLNAYQVADQAGNSPKIIEKHYYKPDRSEILNKMILAL